MIKRNEEVLIWVFMEKKTTWYYPEEENEDNKISRCENNFAVGD